MKRRIGLSLAGAVVLVAAMQLCTQASATGARQGSFKLTAEEVLPLTCLQAWVASEKRYSNMLAVVKTLARVSLANRDLIFPNSRAAGLDAGKGVADDCKADPNALLFAVVDKHVRRLAEATSVR